MSEVYEALLQVQKEITNPSNTAINPFFKSKYAPLPETLNQVRPLLNKHGLILIQNTGSNDEGVPYVQTILLHAESKSTIESDKLLLKPEKKSVQGIGSAITYGRRYQLSAILGISSEDDNDGNMDKPLTKAKPHPKQKPVKNRKPSPAKPTSSAPSDEDINNIIDSEMQKKKPKTAAKKPKPSKKKENKAETIHMGPVNRGKLKGIHDELDIWLNTVENVDITQEEVLTQCTDFLGKDGFELETLKTVKENLGITI